nr:protein 3b [Infectious bronchitis virus]
MLDLEVFVEKGEQVVQQISFNLQKISSVLNTEIFDPFEICFYRGGNYWELESTDDSGDD